METVLRGLFIYVFLLVILRISGKRSLKDITAFDFVLLLIISETTQQAMIDDDNSIINCVILITTLVGANIGLSVLKENFSKFERMIDGIPLIIVENGMPLQERMKKARVDEKDILHAARSTQGLTQMSQIKYAILEKDGSISIISKEEKQ